MHTTRQEQRNPAAQRNPVAQQPSQPAETYQGRVVSVKICNPLRDAQLLELDDILGGTLSLDAAQGCVEQCVGPLGLPLVTWPSLPKSYIAVALVEEQFPLPRQPVDLPSALVLQETLVANPLQPQPACMGDLHVMPGIAWCKLEANAYRQENVTQAATANATCNVLLGVSVASIASAFASLPEPRLSCRGESARSDVFGDSEKDTSLAVFGQTVFVETLVDPKAAFLLRYGK